jgi:hypothetical protein
MTLTVRIPEKSSFVYNKGIGKHPNKDMESSGSAILSLLIFTPFQNVNSHDSHA